MKTCRVVLSLTFLFCLTGTGWTGESALIPVSVTIPAIPGLNAPLESVTIQTSQDRVPPDQQKPQTSADPTEPASINYPAQDKGTSFILEEKNTAEAVVRTVYAR